MLIEMHYWEGLAAADLAPLFGVDPTTIRTPLHRARARLRQAIEALEADATLREQAAGGLETRARDLRALALVDPAQGS